MTLGGLAGFAVVAIVLMMALSLVAAAMFALARPWLRARGSAAEHSAARWALVAPVALVLGIVAVLAMRGSGSTDHCLGHGHHAHLCLHHGGAWLQRAWTMMFVGAAAATLSLRLARVALRRLRTTRALRAVTRVAQPTVRACIVPSERVFCFVAGWRRPVVFVSSRAWDALSDDERDAVIAHEHAHVVQGDLWFGVIADAAAACAAPFVGAWLQAQLGDASERLCDVRAAQRTSPAAVAQALVRMCRAGQVQTAAAGFPPAVELLERRVRAVFTQREPGTSLGAGAWGLAAAPLIAATTFAPQLHHVLETLLG